MEGRGPVTRAAPRENVMNRKIIRIILTTLLAAVFAVSVGMMILHQIEYQKTLADADEAAQIAGLHRVTETRRPETSAPATEPTAGTEPSGSVSLTEEPAEEPTEEPPPEWYLLPEGARDLVWIDLGALRAINPDVVGWICIPGTNVSYPLMQGRDNEYYLTRSWKKEYMGSGSVFLETKVSPDLTDYHTIIYGHRMQNGTMFGSIKYYSGADYWRAHPSVYIVLDDTIYRYDIFAAHEAAVNSIVYRLDIEEKELEEEFLRYCEKQTVLRTGMTPEVGERILTLSTCTGNGYAKRWVVHGVLAQEYSRTKI